MGTGYTKGLSYFVDGETIEASDFTTEFGLVDAAFETGGHQHDGTDGEGGAIEKLLSNSITFGTGADTDIAVTFDGNSSDGVLTWKEDEDYFEFSDDILMASTEKIQFGDTASFIQQSSNGVLRIDGEATIDLNASTAVTVSNDLKLDSDSAVLGFGADNDTTLTHTDGTGLTLNSTNKLTFGDAASFIQQSGDGVLRIDGEATIDLNASTAVTVSHDLKLDSDGAILGFGADNDITLTHTADTGLTCNGTITATGFTIGSAAITETELEILDGASVTTAELNIIDGNTSATSTTVADADRVVLNDNGTMVQVAVTDLAAYFDDEITAMPNLVSTGALDSGSITSGFGTINTGSSAITTTGLISGGSLDIDNVLINGTTIGHTDDTDLITVADGLVTVAGEISVTTLDIGGTNVSSTAAELNIVDGNTSATSTTVADADRVVLNDNGTMVQVAVTDLAAYFDDEITAMPNLVSTGALDTGSITSGFGAIDNGTSGIRTDTFTAETSFVPDAADGATLGTASLEFSDLFLADGGQILFGNDQEITLTHVADSGLTLKHAATADDKFPTLTLAAGDTDIAANDKLGVINFQAPDEGTGTDAILVAAGIEAVSEGDFSSSSNATSLAFKTGSSEAAAEKMRIQSDGDVLIGSTVNVYPEKLLVFQDSSEDKEGITSFANNSSYTGTLVRAQSATASTGGNYRYFDGLSTGGAVNYFVASDGSAFFAGSIGAGTSSPSSSVDIDCRRTGVLQAVSTDTVQLLASNGGSTLKNVSNNPLLFGTNNTEAMRLDSSGRLLIGTTASVSGHQLRVRNASGTCIVGIVAATNFNSTIAFGDPANSAIGKVEYAHNGDEMRFFTNGGERMTISSGGNVAITGSLSKGSGSFKIDHPLESKKDTHHLVHSFIEGPQADLIYRGKVTLSGGTATVNIDTAAGMTSGTFEALCADVQCFTSNETGWIAIKGSVSGATLTIQAQDNSCTDTISWLVVGERKDPHMLATEWTDDDGKVIVELEKSE